MEEGRKERTRLTEINTIQNHTCQLLRFRRSHYVFLDKWKTTGVVRRYYGFILVWGYKKMGNHLIAFGVFLDERMGLSQYS